MAVYKVIQDIEAEDKLLGPLTLKGFIYALTAGFLGFLNFKIITMTGLGNYRWLLLLIFGLPMLLFGVLASPLGREQPTEIWLLSRVRFLVKPRSRVWDQTGLSQLVTITAPKKLELHLTKELSQNEVQSRLQTLAMTMDSRGWAVKNVSVNLNPVPGYLQQEGDSDRLVGASSIPQTVPTVDIRPDDDILDEQHNPIAQKLLGMVKKKDADHKGAIKERVGATHRTPSSITNSTAKRGQPAYHITEDEGELNQKFAEAESSLHNQFQKSENHSPQTVNNSVTANNRADKLELAQSGNDLSVASIQKLANRRSDNEAAGSDEIVVSLR